MDALIRMLRLASIPLFQWLEFTSIYPTFRATSVTRTLFQGIN